MTPVLSALVLTNLLYVVGAVVVASLVSGLYVLRHRKPKSLESGIESFSRELRALAPERRERVPPERRRPAPARPGDGATDPAAAPVAAAREDAAWAQPPPSGPGAEGVPGVPVADPSPPPRAPVPPGTDPALTDYGDGRNPGSRSG